jgi:hypothetical protein
MMILKNPSYMGVRMFNQIKHKTREAKPAGEVVQVASHPAIVSKDDFEKVQTMMKDRTPHEIGGTAKSCFAFTGLLKCGICGEPLQITNGTGRKGVVYNYYSCMAHKNGKTRCLLKPARAEIFDEWMVNELLDKVLTKGVVQKVIDDIRANGGKWAEERAMRRKALVKELRENENKRDKIFEIMETLGKETPNLQSTIERLSVLHQNIKDVQLAIETLETKQAPDYRLVDIDPEMAVTTIHKVIRACPDPKQMRMLMNTFVQQISVSNASVIVEYREDALLRSPVPTVHTGINWLPLKDYLRTGRVEIARPVVWPHLRLQAA